MCGGGIEPSETQAILVEAAMSLLQGNASTTQCTASQSASPPHKCLHWDFDNNVGLDTLLPSTDDDDSMFVHATSS